MMTRTDGAAGSVVGSVVGNYQIIRKLGEGGMGAVYLAQHTLLGRRAALKMLLPMLSARPDVVNRFFNEARATTSISDPGIVQIFDFGYHADGSAYIVMEYLEGEALDARLGRLGRLPVPDALRLIRQVATSLAAAHAQGIVHRDLKPENIYLVRDPEVASGERPKILDFGIAKLSDDQPGKVKTHTGALMGTPLYMSPEQCRGASELDHRSDVYALGCVLFHLIAGAPPFDADGLGDIIAMHLREPAPVLSSRASWVAPNVDALVARCLAKRPEDRFQSMHELAAAIGRVLPHPTGPGAPTQLAPAGHAGGGSSQGSTPTTLGSSTGQVMPPPSRTRWVRALVAVLVLGGGVLGTALAVRGGGEGGVAREGGEGDGGERVAGPAGGGGRAAAAVPPDAAPAEPAVAPDAAIATATAPADGADASAAGTSATTSPAVAASPATGRANATPDKPGPPKRPRPARKPSTVSAGHGKPSMAPAGHGKPSPAPGGDDGPSAYPGDYGRPAGPGAGSSSSDGCDRRVDLDCDGIPDVR